MITFQRLRWIKAMTAEQSKKQKPQITVIWKLSAGLRSAEIMREWKAPTQYLLHRKNAHGAGHDVYDQDERIPDHKKFVSVESASQQFD